MHPIKSAKAAIQKVAKMAIALPFIIKIIAFFSVASIFITALDFVIELFTAENNTKQIYSTFEVEDVKNLVEIKESPDGSGYYLDFVEGFDDKAKAIVNQANNQPGLHNLPKSVEFIKKIIKAEVVTQFPDLGGNIPEGSDGFQGAIDIRRVTPNKEIGSITDNPGRGETSTIEQDTIYDTVASTVTEETIKKWESGQELVVKREANTYNKAGDKIELWFKREKKEEGTLLSGQYETINANTTVTYTGMYGISTNRIIKTTEIYVEVTYEGENVYVRAENLMLKQEENNEEKNNEEENNEEEQTQEGNNNSTNKVATSRATTSTTSTSKHAGKEGESYVIAIAAGHNNSDDTGAENGELKEQELTIKTAEKVEELLKEYTNIKVVQTGSTSSNPSNIKVEDRTRLAREANPDLCIQIHYNAGGGTGVEAIYKDGDNISQQLAEIVSAKMASSMGLTDRGAGTDFERCAVKSLGIIENAADSGFPSIVTEGGFIDADPDSALLKENGTDLCAQGIVDGILEYLVADHSGYTATSIENQSVQESIESRVYNLKYVKQDEFDELIERANNGENSASESVLKSYTLNENNELLTATWSSNNNSIEYKKNAAMSFETSLEKYTMPYEYLLFFYIDTNESDFSDELAEEVLNSEIVIAVQDNITTVETEEVSHEKRVTDPEGYNDYSDNKSPIATTITETCSPKIEITYVDGWCAKYYKENSYSSKVLGWEEGEEEKLLNIKGTSKIESANRTGDTQLVENDTANSEQIDSNGQPIQYEYWVYQWTTADITNMTIKYDTGDATTNGNENKFVDAYINSKAYNYAREAYLFQIIENNERTANLVDLTKYLLFKATNQNFGVLEYDFSEFDLSKMNSVTGGAAGGLSLTTPVLSREVFIEAMEAYGSKTGNYGFLTNFMPYAGEIYDVSLEAGVNPELVVVTAKNEQNFVSGGGSFNYWGIGVTNGSQSGGSYSSLADGIRAYAATLSEYMPGGRFDATITQRYEERRASGCDPLGYGLPGTFSGMQSVYSFLGIHEYGSSGAGGYYYMDPDRAGVTHIYSTHQEFLEKCANAGGEHALGTVTTVWEQGQYTAWQVQGKIDAWNEIFGDYGTLTAGGSGEIVPAVGDGYSQEYTSSTGRTYREYKQWMGSYANFIFAYYSPQTVGSSGCSITSIAVVTSGYNNNQTPGSLSTRVPVLSSLLTEGGAQCSGYEAADAARLTSGRPAVVSISGTLITERGSKYYGGHYIAILDGRNGNEVYVSDVGANDSFCGGWTDVQNIINIVSEGVLYVNN